VVFAAVADLVPRDDRDVNAQVFAAFSAEKCRTAIAKACRAAGAPVFSPHDLRHRPRHALAPFRSADRRGCGMARSLAVEHVKTYAHAALSDRPELDYALMLVREERMVPALVPSSR
jgi:hypothetical protein